MVTSNDNDLPQHTFDTLTGFMGDMVFAGMMNENDDGSCEFCYITQGDLETCLGIARSIVAELEAELDDTEDS